MSSSPDHIDPLVAQPQTVPFIPIDPFLGRHQHWQAIRDSLLESLVVKSDSDTPSAIAEELSRYLLPSRHSFRPLLIQDFDRDRVTGLLARSVGGEKPFQSDSISVTFIRHQPRLKSLRLLVRKTGIELSSALNLGNPPPADNDDIFRWFRSVLNHVRQPAIMIWDGIDLAEDFESGDPWFWLTSPLPPNVRLILSAAPGERTSAWQTRGMETLTLHSAPPITTDQYSLTPLQEEIARLIRASRGGRTIDELAELLPQANDTEILEAIDEMNPLLGYNDQKHWFLTDKANVFISRDDLKRIGEWLRVKPEESDAWLWEYPYLLAQLERWDELAEIFTRPTTVWRWWNHYRADIIDLARKMEENSDTSMTEIANRAPLLEGFRPHHALAYAALLTATDEHASALRLLREITDAPSSAEYRLHLLIARRRAVECARRMGDLGLAWDLLQTLEREIPSTADFRTRGQVTLLACELLIQKKDWKEVNTRLQEIEGEAQVSNQPWFEAEALRLEAETAAAESNDAALCTVDSKFLSQARTHGWDHCHVDPLLRELRRKLASEDWESARTLALTLQETAAQLADIHALSESLGMLAMLENRDGRYREMASILAAKERLCREVGDLPGVIDLLLSRAVAMGFRLNDRESAHSLAQDALRWATELDDRERQAKARQLLERMAAKS